MKLFEGGVDSFHIVQLYETACDIAREGGSMQMVYDESLDWMVVAPRNGRCFDPKRPIVAANYRNPGMYEVLATESSRKMLLGRSHINQFGLIFDGSGLSSTYRRVSFDSGAVEAAYRYYLSENYIEGLVLKGGDGYLHHGVGRQFYSFKGNPDVKGGLSLIGFDHVSIPVGKEKTVFQMFNSIDVIERLNEATWVISIKQPNFNNGEIPYMGGLRSYANGGKGFRNYLKDIGY